MGQLDDINATASGAVVGGFQPGDPYSTLYGNNDYDKAVGSYFDATSKSMTDAAAMYSNNLHKLVRDGLDDFGQVSTNGAKPEQLLDAGVLEVGPDGLVKINQQAAARMYPNGFPPDFMGGLNKVVNDQNQRLQNNADWNQLRQAQNGVQQRLAAVNAEKSRMTGANQGFAQEMQRFDQQRANYEGRQAPNLMNSYMAPALANAGNAAMAAANSTAGGSLGQAAARRGAMTGFGQQAAVAVPQALAQQGSLDMQQRSANDAMAQQYNQLRAQSIQNQFANNMASSAQNFQQQMAQEAFQKAMEQAVHDRSMEGYKVASDIVGKVAQGTGMVAGGFSGMTGGSSKEGNKG